MEKGARRVAVIVSNFRSITNECINRLKQVEGIKIIDFGKALKERVDGECLAIDGTETTVDNGRLLSEDLIAKTLKSILRKPEYMEGFIVLIGYPRTVIQLDNLAKHFKYLHGDICKNIIFLRPDVIVEQELAGGYYCQKCNLTDYHYFDDTVQDLTCIFCGSKLALREKESTDRLVNEYNDYKMYTKEICRNFQKINTHLNLDISIITVENIDGISLDPVVEQIQKELKDF